MIKCEVSIMLKHVKEYFLPEDIHKHGIERFDNAIRTAFRGSNVVPDFWKYSNTILPPAFKRENFAPVGIIKFATEAEMIVYKLAQPEYVTVEIIEETPIRTLAEQPDERTDD
jgi:hypothetical protein